MAYTLDQLTAAYRAANNGVQPDAAASVELQVIAHRLLTGWITDQTAMSYVVNSADNDVSVAVQVYQFFTARTPTKAGLDYLVNSPANPNDLNDPYYAKFGLEDRYINFALNLGVLGEGASHFSSVYGGLTFDAFVTAAYQAIIGSSYAIAAGIDPAAAIADITSRKANFEAIARQAGVIGATSTAAQVDIAVKAALIGYLMGEGVKADVGLYAAGANNFIHALVTGNAQYGVDLTTVYSSLGGGMGNNNVPPPPPPPEEEEPVSQSFTLTTAADTFTGGGADDTFTAYISASGPNSTLNATDVLKGGGGTDTLVLTVDGAGAGAFPAATITGIEVFRINETGGTDGVYDFAAVSAETSVVNNKSTDAVTFNNIGTGASLSIVGDGAVTNGATTFTMAAATDAVTLNLQGGLKGGANITRNQTGAATVVVNSTGGANAVGVIDLDTATALSGLTINATTNLTGALAADYAAASTLTVTGAGQVDLSAATLSTNFSQISSAAQTAGGLIVKVGALTNFTGGAGNDGVYVDALVYNNPAITAVGGGGTDTVRFTDQAALTATTALYLTGFEVIALADDNDGALDTFDASLMAGIQSFVLGADSAGDGYSVTNLSVAQAGAITISGAQTVAPTLALANAAGGTDVVSITVNDGLAAVNTLSVANLNIASVETVNLALTDNLTLSSIAGLTGFTKLAVTGAGALNLTTGALAVNPATTIDASAATGTVTINASAATGNGLTLKGSATQANTLTGTTQADTIVGGDGVDILTGRGGNDTLTGGNGADIFVVTNLTQAANGTDSYTDFNFGTATTAVDQIRVDVTSTTIRFGTASSGITAASGTEILVLDVNTYADANAAQTAARSLFGNNDNAAEAIVIWQLDGGDLQLSLYTDFSADATANGALQTQMVTFVGLNLANAASLINAGDFSLV